LAGAPIRRAAQKKSPGGEPPGQVEQGGFTSGRRRTRGRGGRAGGPWIRRSSGWRCRRQRLRRRPGGVSRGYCDATSDDPKMCRERRAVHAKSRNEGMPLLHGFPTLWRICHFYPSRLR
jgi:hypothetical protein